jgi:hypothetical protein
MSTWSDTMSETPWYKQFWPWALIALPATAVAASIATLMIAMHEPDGVVADDYYKQGLAINRVIERDRRAATLGVSAAVTLNSGGGRSMVVLTADQPLADEAIRLRFLHPTRANQDYETTLRPSGSGVYLGDFRALAPGNWHVQLESEDGDWRLSGRMRLPQESSVRLEAVER